MNIYDKTFSWPNWETHTAKNSNVYFRKQSKPIVLLFSDDSTLFFCLRMRKLLRSAQSHMPIKMAWYTDESALSYRQMAMLLPNGPDLVLDKESLTKLAQNPNIKAIITSRVYRPLQATIIMLDFRLRADRPCILSFLGGLDFTPEKGFQHRIHCDAVYLFPKSAINVFKQFAKQYDNGWQVVEFGHPYLVMPQKPPQDITNRKDIYFFAQALSPITKRGRLHMLKILQAMALRYSDRTIWIKLRHHDHENKTHLHREKFSYETLFHSLTDAPKNLKLTACSMDDALDNAAFGITCTSTAAIDVIRSGIPAMVYLDYQDNYRDPLVDPMRKLFSGSGVITTLQELMNLDAKPVHSDWIDTMFCPHNLGEQVLQTISQFYERPFQIQPNLYL